MRRIAALIPRGRAGRVTETAEAICLLLSEAASYITAVLHDSSQKELFVGARTC
jgi:hypothetical protein